MNKFTLVILVIASSLGGTTANAQNSFWTAEVHMQVTDAQVTPTYDLYAGTAFEESRWGIQAFAAVVPGWGQAYAGPTYQIADGLNLSLMAGAQTDAGNLVPRYGASALWAAGDRFSGMIFLEFDHGGIDTIWYNVTAKYQTVNWMQLGVFARRFAGIGPGVWFTIPETPFGFWATWTPGGPEERTDLSRSSFALTASF